MYSTHFDDKQCQDRFQQPQAYDPSPVLCSGAFRYSFICSLLLDLDSYGGNDSNGMLSLFYKQVVRELVPKLAVIFRHLVRRGSFQACWRLVDVVPVPKGSASSDVLHYRSTSIMPVLLKVFEKIVNRKLNNFLKRNSMLSPSQFSYRRLKRELFTRVNSFVQ